MDDRLFAAMRRLEALAAPAPRWGEAALPSAEALRVGRRHRLRSRRPAWQRSSRRRAACRCLGCASTFGYLGPNGPLPIHLSDLIRDRVRNQGDGTWLAFLDSFGHRFALHFYRAWTQPRPAVALDRPGDEAWRRWIGAFVGIGTPARRQRNAVFDDARLHFSGWLARRVHCNEGIEAVIGRYFDAPARLESWVGHWLPIARDERTYLGGNRMGQGRPGADAAQRLGGGAVLGRQVWDRQHRVRLRLGPLSLARYRQFLPTGSALPALGDWMRQLLGDELQWDSELVLKKQEVPRAAWGRRQATRRAWAGCAGWVSVRARATRRTCACQPSCGPLRPVCRQPWTRPPLIRHLLQRNLPHE
ncbi:type VI secretion system baseplate subunit TssG [Ottowia pentelensis]|uniref:type VI secretion system baseplate subunit TssG n=1 Tax=Ottowia pentelensis TaxID=511108 RepID=UPI00362AE39E